MKNLISILLVGILLISCTTNKESEIPNSTVALDFINSYINNCNKMNKAISPIEWVKENLNATSNFKKQLEKLITEGYKNNPELGLGFDPIFNAQDYPEEGVELESLDTQTGYLIVRGKKWTDFKLTMKLKKENGAWLVDGCGIINIPKDKMK